MFMKGQWRQPQQSQQNRPQIKSLVLDAPTFDFIKLETELLPMEVKFFSTVLSVFGCGCSPYYCSLSLYCSSCERLKHYGGPH